MRLVDGIAGLRCSATVNNAPQQGSSRRLGLYRRLKCHFVNSMRAGANQELHSVTWKRKHDSARKPCRRSRKTQAGHALVRSLVRAVTSLSRLFHATSLSHSSAVFSSFAGCPRRSSLTCKAERKKKKRRKKRNGVDAHVRPGRPRRVAFSQVFRVKRSGR